MLRAVNLTHKARVYSLALSGGMKRRPGRVSPRFVSGLVLLSGLFVLVDSGEGVGFCRVVVILAVEQRMLR